MEKKNLITLMAQHGHCFESVAIDALQEKKILKDPEIIKALEQSLTILTKIVTQLKKETII